MIGVIIAVLKIYQLIIIIRAVQTWMTVDPRHPMVRWIAAVTEPVLAPVRSFTMLGTVDFSPVVVVVVIQLVIRMLGG
jgi:YggT family protein